MSDVKNDGAADGNGTRTGTKRITRARTAVKIAIAAVIVISVGFHTGWGTYSSLGIDFVASICPLGALEALFGSWQFIPRLLIALAAMLVVVLLFGRAFCAWVCPVPPLQAFFRTRTRREKLHAEQAEAGTSAYRRWLARAGAADGGRSGATDGAAGRLPDAPAADPGRAKGRMCLDSRHVVLCGALGSAAIFGFPVFCLVCPVGLTCAVIVLLMRLMGVGELSWGLLVFPLLLVLEMTVLRRWCAKICPIAALMSLVGRLNKTFRPRVETSACLRSAEGQACHACASACPEHIDPRGNDGLVPEHECTRCGKCLEACPAHAISFPALRREGDAPER